MHVITLWYKLFEVKKTCGAANRNSNQLVFFTANSNQLAFFNQKAPQGGCGHRRQHARLC